MYFNAIQNRNRFCVQTFLKEQQLALLETQSYPDKNQSGSNGLEHVSMDNQHIKNSSTLLHSYMYILRYRMNHPLFGSNIIISDG